MSKRKNVLDRWVYRIDENDVLYQVSENWSRFARENGAAQDSITPPLFEKKLWDYFSDPETIHLYGIIVDQVRKTHETVAVPFNCDSPKLRRFFVMQVNCIEDHHVEFASALIRTEKRDSVRLLDVNEDRSNEFVKICSFCKKISMLDETWLETDLAVARLKLFESVKLPQLTHGICPTCLEGLLEELEQKKAIRLNNKKE